MKIDLGLSAPLFVFDVESLPNFTSVVVRDVNSSATQRDRFFCNYPGLHEPFSALRDLAQTPALWIGFNILSYDNSMMTRILRDGVDDAATLKLHSNSVITSPDVRSYDLGAGEVTLDLYGMYKGKNGKVGSLKRVASFLDIEEYQEMPFPHDRPLANESEMRTLLRYNRMDVVITERMLEVTQEMVRIRIALAERYGLDISTILNSADSKLAEEVLAVGLFAGARPQYSRRTMWSISGAEITDGFEFHSPDLIAVRDRIATWQLDYSLNKKPRKGGGVEKEMVSKPFAETFRAFGITINLAKGGLHSVDPPGVIEANDVWAIWDYDVKSFYPMLMIRNEWAPAHLDQQKFTATLDAVVTERLAAKAAGDKLLAQALKVAANSVFGKSGSGYSWLVDPTLTARVCLTGEMILLQTAERLTEVEGADVSILSLNTDGMMIRVRRSHAAVVTQAMVEAIDYFGMTVEAVEYRHIWRRDGNSYIALPMPTEDDPTPAAKCRGDYGYERWNLEKSPTRRIVADAVQRHWLAGVDVEATINGCTDLRQFIDFVSTGKANVLIDDAGVEHGNVARWYRSTAGVALKIQNRETGKQSSQPKADRITVVGDLPHAMPADVDRAWYIEEAKSLIAAVENPPEKKGASHQVEMADLSSEQRARHIANAECAMPDIARCDAVDLTRYHRMYEQMVKGNSWATMTHIVRCIWWDGKGELTRGDLRELIERVVGFDWAGAKARTVDKAVDRVAYLMSAIPKPRSRDEIIEAALCWAREHVDVATRKRKLYYHGIQNTNYVTGTTVNRYLRNHDPYPLACAICATFVKYGLELDRDFIGRIMDDVIAVEHVEPH